ncbi:MAG: hypothetical protein ACI38Q_05505 [Candidatus Bruticola sp.]
MSDNKLPPHVVGSLPQRRREQDKTDYDSLDYQPPSQELSEDYVITSPGTVLTVLGIAICVCVALIIYGTFFKGGGVQETTIPLSATLTQGKDVKANISPSQWVTLSVPSTVEQDQIISTGADRIYFFELPDNASLRADAYTSFKFNSVKKIGLNTVIYVTLFKGSLFVSDSMRTKVAVSTKFCHLNPLATKYGVKQVEATDLTEKTEVRVYEGSVEAVHADDEKMKFVVNANQQIDITDMTVKEPYAITKDNWANWNKKWKSLSEIKNGKGVRISRNVLNEKLGTQINQTNVMPTPTENFPSSDPTDYQHRVDQKAVPNNRGNGVTSGTIQNSPMPAPAPNTVQSYEPPKTVPAPNSPPSPPKKENRLKNINSHNENFKPVYGGDSYAPPTRRGDEGYTGLSSSSRQSPPRVPHAELNATSSREEQSRRSNNRNNAPTMVAPPPAVPSAPQYGGNQTAEFAPVENSDSSQRRQGGNSEQGGQQAKKDPPEMMLDQNGFMYPRNDYENAATNSSGDPLDAITDPNADVLRAKPPSKNALDAATYR